MTREPDPPGSFHGRRKGKALRPGQDRLIRELLPRLRIAIGRDGSAFPDEALVCGSRRELRLEIGFGGGEHLAAAARAEPDVGFIGCEPFVNGMAKLLAVIEAEGLRNIRLWDQPAADLLAALPDASLGRVHLLFPDPWPKRRQRKRRFVSDASLQALGRVMRSGAELRFATDIDDYAGWTLARVLRSAPFRWAPAGPADWRQPWPGWPGTRYEAKAEAAGRPASYLTFMRI